jgi:peptide deformylase
LLARVIQHELDHLNGVMFVDRVQNAIALNKEFSKYGFSVKDVQQVVKN